MANGQMGRPNSSLDSELIQWIHLRGSLESSSWTTLERPKKKPFQLQSSPCDTFQNNGLTPPKKKHVQYCPMLLTKHIDISHHIIIISHHLVQCPGHWMTREMTRVTHIMFEHQNKQPNGIPNAPKIEKNGSEPHWGAHEHHELVRSPLLHSANTLNPMNNIIKFRQQTNDFCEVVLRNLLIPGKLT